MPKRKFDVLMDETVWSQAVKPGPFKNSLDSEEEDDEVEHESYNIMKEEDFKGVEEGPLHPDAAIGFTAFNVKEELEEGHFDQGGNYVWKKEKEIRDNWLDDIDWVKIKSNTNPDGKTKGDGDNDAEKGLADSDSDDEDHSTFDPTSLYKEILNYLQPGETISKALCRLGKSKKRISSAERWKRKKAGLSETDENSVKITKLTELANELLTRTGNMDIYQESYESIHKKVKSSATVAAELDMYADDFDTKEKEKLDTDPVPTTSTSSTADDGKAAADPLNEEVTWQLKWSQNDDAETSGPHTTKQMFAWANEGYFKNSAFVRRIGQTGQFYNASRVDFELYI